MPRLVLLFPVDRSAAGETSRRARASAGSRPRCTRPRPSLVAGAPPARRWPQGCHQHRDADHGAVEVGDDTQGLGAGRVALALRHVGPRAPPVAPRRQGAGAGAAARAASAFLLRAWPSGLHRGEHGPDALGVLGVVRAQSAGATQREGIGGHLRGLGGAEFLCSRAAGSPSLRRWTAGDRGRCRACHSTLRCRGNRPSWCVARRAQVGLDDR